MTEARVPVTVEDREAGQRLLDRLHAMLRRQGAEVDDKKVDDDGEIVQALAAHRLAGVAAGREEACKAFEHRMAEGYDVPACKADHCIHGRFDWEDCIACYDDALEDTIAAIRQMGGK